MGDDVRIPHRRHSSGRMPTSAAASLRAVKHELTEQIVVTIQHQIAAYAAPPPSQRHLLISRAVEVAVGCFVDLHSGRSVDLEQAAVVFEQLGEAEAVERGDLTSMELAWQLATANAQELLTQLGESSGLRPGELVGLNEALQAFTIRLFDCVKAGFRRPRWRRDPRARLLTELVMARADRPHNDRARWETLAAAASWRLPEQVVVGIVDPAANTPTGTQRSTPRLGQLLREILGGEALIRPNQGWLVFLTDAAVFAPRRNDLASGLGSTRGAFSWPEPVLEAHQGYRWAKRAIRLRREGFIVSRSLIDCADHVELLLLRSSPAIRQHLIDTALAPLLIVRPERYRIDLAATLHRWLLTQEPAQTLARSLGVSAGTVRNHERRLKALYGDRLQEPTTRLHIMLALEIELPRWRRDAHYQAAP